MNDNRIKLISDWLTQIFGHSGIDLAPASADASFRRYFRVSFGGNQRIVMDAPPEHEDCRPFIAVSSLLLKCGLNVPEVLEQDLDKGLLLLTDLGSRTYLNELNDQSAVNLYGDAISSLIQMQSHKIAADALPAYDHSLLMTEMSLFPDWYLEKHLGLNLTEQEQIILNDTFVLLAETALLQPKVLVHRDYHSRNLMVCETNDISVAGGNTGINPGILDFQDAVIGPVTYDLVSLLRDCYIKWPLERVRDWAISYFEQAKAANIIGADISEEQFMRWFDFMGIQRHLKASGIFARLNHRDNKPGYLEDIPRTLSYIRDVAANYPELEGFNNFMQQLDHHDHIEQNENT